MSWRGWGRLLFAGVGTLGLFCFAQGSLTISSMGEMSDLVSTNETWMVEEFASADWSAWEAEVASGFDALADVATSVPPSPTQLVTFLRASVEELPALFLACTNAVPSEMAYDVPSWTIRVVERTDSDGSRYFLTLANDVVLHVQSVPATFDPEAWSLNVYAPDGLPTWIANDPEARAEWFELRERKRLGLEYLFLEPGKYSEYYANLEAAAAAERAKREAAANEKNPPSEFGVTEMEVLPRVVSFGFYNPLGVDLDVFGASTLKNWPSPLILLGRMVTQGAHQVYFEVPRATEEKAYFYQMLDASTDSDGDGIPDGLEEVYFGTDPLRRDTSGSGVDDWTMIYRYGLDATVADGDGDGLPDGWEVLHGLDPTSAVGDNGADGDPDNDGIKNLLELSYNTHPMSADSDEDSLNDGDETGYAVLLTAEEQATDPFAPNLDTTSEYTLLRSVDAAALQESPTVQVSLPFVAHLGGNCYSRVTLSSTGVATFSDPDHTRTLKVSLFESQNLDWRTVFRSEIRAVHLANNGNPCVVIEFLNFGLKDVVKSSTLGRIQLVIPDPSTTSSTEEATVSTASTTSEVDRTALRVNTTTLQGSMTDPLATEVVITTARPDERYAELYTVASVSIGDTLLIQPGAGTDPTEPDTDGDGVLDGAEILAGTSASTNDNDFDGLPDWWEAKYSNSTERDGDADGDSLTNYQEFCLGTNPEALDSDGDGLPDASEAGGVTRASGVKAEDTSKGTETFSTLSDNSQVVALPFSLTIGNSTYTHLAWHEKGLVTFLPSANAALTTSGLSENQDLNTSPLDLRYPSIAVYWDDLVMTPHFRSEVRLVDMGGEEGKRVAVLEMLNLAKSSSAFESGHERSSSLARIQMILRENIEKEGIEVRYPTLQGSFNGESATLGFQHAGGLKSSIFALTYNENGKLALGDSIRYFPGLGTDPAQGDSDYDGLDDASEITLGTDPWEPDTDGDGMCDGWEVKYGFEPLVAEADTVTQLDPDSDGITTWQEAIYGTDPYSSDTDNDNVPDKTEIEQGSDPLDASDSTPLNTLNKIQATFSIDGDYAAWEMLIRGTSAGLGGTTDNRIQKMYMREVNEEASLTAYLRKGCSYNISMRWLKSKEGPSETWYCWGAQVNGQPKEATHKDYKSTRENGVATLIIGEGFIVENDDGLLSAHVHMKEGEGGNVAGGLTATIHALGFSGCLTPDYNRDGLIDSNDITKIDAGTRLPLWVNNDNDEVGQSYATGKEDIPGKEADTGNCSGSDSTQVDGLCDLLDFFPVHLGLAPALEFLDRREDLRAMLDSGELTFKLSHAENAVNVVWTSLVVSNANQYLSEQIKDCGDNLQLDILSASVTQVTDTGIVIPEVVLDSIRDNAEKGVFLMEGKFTTTEPLKLGLYHESGTVVWQTELPLKVCLIKDMYSGINLRKDTPVTTLATGMPHDATLPNVIFLHGFNVSEEGAQGWHSEMYKRLYQSGTDMNFFGVTWKGDETLAGLDSTAFHYHCNVKNAFSVAPSFATMMRNLPSGAKTIVLAHSLGNMIVSHAICNYEFKPEAYVLLNAAIPMEAFDATLQDTTCPNALIPDAWETYDSRTYASRWHELFTSSEPQSKMKWAGVFADIFTKSPKTQFYNYYSTGDEIFEMADSLEDSVVSAALYGTLTWTDRQNDGFLSWFASFFPERTFSRYAWQKQEFLKGTDLLVGTTTGGWRFETEGEGDTKKVRYSATDANAMCSSVESIATFKTAPVFCASSEMLTPNSDPTTQLDEWREILAYRIPALSPAMGGGAFESDVPGARITSISLEPPSNAWPRKSGAYRGRWLHSDIKNVAYPYVYTTFRNLRVKIAQ